MTIEEWKVRYKAEFMARVKDARFAQQCVDAAEFPGVMDGYEDDPEGAAQMEMSYWEPQEGNSDD